MPINPDTDQLLTLGQAARRARPAGERPVSPSTVWRWHTRGVAGVRLETLCLGSKRYTSVEAMDAFFHAITAARTGRSNSEENGDSGERSPELVAGLERSGLLSSD